MASALRRAWEGWYFDGRTARRTPVRIFVVSDGLSLSTADGHTMHWPYGGIRQTQGGEPGEHVRLEYGADPPQVMTVPDPAILSAMSAASPVFRSRFRRSATSRRWVVVTVLAAILLPLLIWSAYAWGVPAFANAVAERLPVTVEEELGEAVLGQLAPPDQRCVNREGRAELDELLALLRSAAPPSPYMYRVVVIREPMPNAFAAPGGHVVITQGLLSLAQRPEELAGVLAHEIQHVEQRHGTKLLVRELSFQALVALLTGDARGVGSALSAARTIGSLRYRRQDEFAADDGGLRMLAAAGIDPQGLITMLRKLQEAVGDVPAPLTYLSTHPSTEERIMRLERAAGEAGTRPSLVLRSSWSKIARFCQP